MHSHHDKTRGWQPFWAALGAALLVLLPLVGGTILLTRQSLRTKLAAKPQSGVAVRMPKTENQLTLLVCTAGEQPGFVLLYLNASQNCIRLAALPAETAIPFGQGEATLAQCYAAAGPARCREALLGPLALPETTRYLALSPSVLAAIADRYGMLRVGFSGALTADELAQCGLSGGVQALSAREAESLFSGWDKDGTLPPSHRAAARAAVLYQSMPENKDYLTHEETLGTIQISEDVVASIATSTALEVEGVGGLLSTNMSDYLGGKKMTARGVRVEMEGDAIVVNLFIMLRYGFAVAEVAEKVQTAVFSALEGMTGFAVKAVNVHVGGITFD